MISNEFRQAATEGNLLRVKVMLKDSLILDPGFQMFEEMLDYAKRYFPRLIQEHDGEQLETDETNWNRNLMNLELTQLVNNFSIERIEHIKKLVQRNILPRKIRAASSKPVPNHMDINGQISMTAIVNLLMENARITKIIGDILKSNRLQDDEIKKLELATTKMMMEVKQISKV